MTNWYDNEITRGILKAKYLHEGEESFENLVDRVSSIFGDIKDEVKTAMLNADITPAGRILYGAGYKDDRKVSLSNCYIVGNVPEDSLESISQIDYEISRIGSMGGGVGIALDNIRPKGTKINNSARISDGVSFVLNKINNTGENIGQYTRRMAIMVALICNHPDIFEFLHVKENNQKLSAMNISIKFTDDFMKAVKNNEDYELKFEVKSTGEIVNKTINARDFFKEFCEVNRDWGDPGCIFIDRVKNYNLLSGYKDYSIDVSNPCAEFFGNRGNSCNLGSINLYNVVDNKFTKDASVNTEKLDKLVRLGVRMLNKTLDYGYSMQPLDLNRACIDDWRSIGLGVFGVADMFIAMGIKYGSEESLKVISDVFDTMNIVALDESAEIAKETKTFGKYSWSKTNKSTIIQALKLGHKPVYDKIKKYGLANGTLLSIAPTGTISLFMGGLSGGCEPLFKVGYERTTHSSEDEGKHFTVFARSVKDLIEYSKLGSNITIDEVKAKFPFIVESHEIKPIDRIAMQSIMQDYTDNAISSTINLPEGTSADTIFDIYVKAWEQGLKGVTVFVDNCKRGNILGVNTNKKEEEIKSVVTYDTVSPISRRSTAEVAGKTYRLRTACVDKFYITVNKTDEGDVFEIFANPSGGCQANITTITRLISMSLRSGVKVDEIINELGSMKCPACQALRRRGEKDVELSCGNALATALRKAYKDDYVAPVVVKGDNTAVTVDNSRGLYECPECHQKTLRLEAKCSTCSNCGYSKCE